MDLNLHCLLDTISRVTYDLLILSISKIKLIILFWKWESTYFLCKYDINNLNIVLATNT